MPDAKFRPVKNNVKGSPSCVWPRALKLNSGCEVLRVTGGEKIPCAAAFTRLLLATGRRQRENAMRVSRKGGCHATVHPLARRRGGSVEPSDRAHRTHQEFFGYPGVREHIDDLEDLYLAEQRLSDIRAGKTQTVSLEEVVKRYGLGD